MKDMQRIPFPRRSFFLGAVASIALVGCGGGTSTPSTVPVGTDLEVHAISGLRWDKDSYTAKAGDIDVALVNDDSIHHVLVVLKDDTILNDLELKVYKSGEIDSGTIALDAGTYSIFCTVPGHQSMKAELIVE